MKKILFDKKHAVPRSPVNNIIELLQDSLGSNRVISPGLTRTALSLESVSIDDSAELNRVCNDLHVSIEAIIGTLGNANQYHEAQINAGVAAGVLAGDYNQFLSFKQDFPVVSTESIGVVPAFGLSDEVNSRSYSLEAYDERENRNAVVYSIAYNMQASRQDEFGETWFPTLVMTPDNVGFGIVINLMTVFEGITRKMSGDFTDFNRKNIIRAIADPTVLKKEQTKITPVSRAQSVAYFVPSALIPPETVIVEGESIQTAPLAVGKKFDLLGISQTDTLLAAGVMDMTDSIDPFVNLQFVYIKFGNDILKFNTSNLPLSNFTYATQNNYRIETLNFETKSILINKDTKQYNGDDLVDLAGVVTNDLSIRVELMMAGSINIEMGDCSVFGNLVQTYIVRDANGNELDQTAAPAAAVVAVINAGDILGYDLLAYRTNMNRRQRGQLINNYKYSQLYNVPIRSPITALHPIQTSGEVDASDVQSLITTTRIRTTNEAVTNLVNAAAVLREYVDVRDPVGIGPDVLGVGRFFVRPTYYEEAIDVNTVIDSLKSHERAADIQAVLVNKIRDYAYRMYTESEYKAAADALAGGIAPIPTVIIGTDPTLARYLNVTGDLRTLGGEFNVHTVSTLDFRVRGKIFISFGTFDETRNVSPNPLNFGNMIWSSELVLTAAISRDNQVSKETVVQPRYRFITHLPVLTVLEVSNIPDVFDKVAINFHSV